MAIALDEGKVKYDYAVDYLKGLLRVFLCSYVARISRENRNISTHYIREPTDLNPFCHAAVHTLDTEYRHLFDNLYNPVRKALELKVAMKASKPYEEALGELKTRELSSLRTNNMKKLPIL